MTLDDRWEKTQREYQAPNIGRGFPLRQTNNHIIRFGFIAVIIGLTACASRIRPYTASQALLALKTQAAEIQTEKGRAWVSAKSPEQSESFPAIVVIDRSNPSKPLMRIEGVDLFGSTHDLMILDAKSRLTWIDFDAHRISEIRGDWHGLPVAQLPDLLIGLAYLPAHGKVGQPEGDGFEMRLGKARYRYLMTWIDPGPRLALSDVEGTTPHDSFSAHYSKYMDTPDFYLPEEVDLKGKSGHDAVDIHISWRHRDWNEKVAAKVFQHPRGSFKGFTREQVQ